MGTPHNIEHIYLNGKEVWAEVANRDSDGNIIKSTYQKTINSANKLSSAYLSGNIPSSWLGTDETQAARGNHTHTMHLGTSTAASIKLSYGGKYSLTAGGESVTFEMPSKVDIPTFGTAAQKNWTNTITKDETSLPTAGAVYTYVANQISGQAQYCGVATGINATTGELTNLTITPERAGDWCYSNFNGKTTDNKPIHQGDLLICASYNSSATVKYLWNVIHAESNTNTWRDFYVDGVRYGAGNDGVALKFGNSGSVKFAWDSTGKTVTATVSGYVPTTRKVNNHALTGDITITASDVGLGNVKNQSITVTSSSVSDGTNTFNKYSHPNAPAGSAKTAGLYRIGCDSTGHVVFGDAFTIPTVPGSLKNPNSFYIRTNSDTSDLIAYDGSSLKRLYVKPSTTVGAFILTDGTTQKTIQLAGKFTDTVYTHPTYTEKAASAIYQIGRDSTGHVIFGSEVTSLKNPHSLTVNDGPGNHVFHSYDGSANETLSIYTTRDGNGKNIPGSLHIGTTIGSESKGTDIIIASEATATTAGLVSTGNQTFGGDKTFSSINVLGNLTVDGSAEFKSGIQIYDTAESDGAYAEFLYDVYSEGVTIQHFNSENQPDETKSNGVIVTSHNPTSSDNVITNIYSKTISISW